MSQILIYSFHYQDELNDSQRKKLSMVLNLFEKQKVENFKIPLDADISLISRFLLRSILAPLLGQKPSEIEFLYNEYNRPYLDGIDFNLSDAYFIGWMRDCIDTGCKRRRHRCHPETARSGGKYK